MRESEREGEKKDKYFDFTGYGWHVVGLGGEEGKREAGRKQTQARKKISNVTKTGKISHKANNTNTSLNSRVYCDE